MKPRITLSVDKMLEISSVSKFKRKFILKSVKWLENYFGSRVFLEVPEELTGISPEIFPFLKIVRQMREDGIAKGKLETGWQDKNIFKFLPDEIFYPIYRIKFAPKNKAIGADFFDEKKALLRCLGELAERYVWNYSSFFYKGKTVKASYAQLKKEGRRVINIFNIVGFTEEQKKKHKCLQFNENTIFEWIEANSLLEKGKIYCPVQLFSSVYYVKNVRSGNSEDIIGYLGKKEPMLRWGTSTGSATGKTVASALLSGILEIIERDAIIINHFNKLSPPQYDLDNLSDHPEMKKILKRVLRYNLEPHFFSLPTDFPVFVTATALLDKSGIGPALIFGASADFEIKEGIRDSLLETLGPRMGREFFMRMKIKKTEDLDLYGRMAYWARPENFHQMDFLFKGRRIEIDFERDKKIFEGENNKSIHEHREEAIRKLNILKKGFIDNKCNLYWVETTPPEIERAGFKTIYAVSPELQPLHLYEKIPCLGGNRLKDVPEKLGYKPADEFNQCPQPLG